jgi:hypothetical protein
MRGRMDGVRAGTVILLLLAAAMLAPLVDEAVWFLSEAPYVRLLPLAGESGESPAAFVLRFAVSLLGIAPHD